MVISFKENLFTPSIAFPTIYRDLGKCVREQINEGFVFRVAALVGHPLHETFEKDALLEELRSHAN